MGCKSRCTTRFVECFRWQFSRNTRKMNKILTNFTSFIYFFFSRFSFDTRVYEFLKRDELLGRNREPCFFPRFFRSFWNIENSFGTVIIKGKNKGRNGEGMARWRADEGGGKRQKRITRKGRSNDEYCPESRSKEDRTCETNRNFLLRDKRDIERGWIRNVRRWKHPSFSPITRRAIPSSIFLYLCLLNSLLLRDIFFFLDRVNVSSHDI